MRFPFLLLAATLISAPAFASTNVEHPKQVDWAFDGVFGTFDKPSVQRGLQVYKEVCATCHGLNRVAFRTLQGVGFAEGEVKALAAGYTIMDGPNDDGEMFERPGRASDKFPSPYANEQAARAINNGAYPPDLSLITKAREDGPNYVYSILTGYQEAPAYRCEEVNADGNCIKYEKVSAEEAKAVLEAEAAKAAPDAAPEAATEVDAAEAEEAPADSKVGRVFYCSDIVHGEETDAEGNLVKTESCNEMGGTMHYNPYFPGKQIAMPSPLGSDGLVEYQDGTEASREQMARDVVSFLQWAAEPEMEARKRMGIKVMLFLVAFTGFFYVAKKRIWSKVH